MTDPFHNDDNRQLGSDKYHISGDNLRDGMDRNNRSYT
jgi:hypothetical protein